MKNVKAALHELLHAALALLGALLLGGVVIALAQQSIAAPLDAYRALFGGAFGSRDALAASLGRATPLLLTGAAVTVGLRAGLFNIGAQGQLTIGALGAAAVGFALALPAPVLLPLALLVGALLGGLWAIPTIWLKERRGAHEVITAILLNYVALNVTRWLASGPLKAPGDAPQTPEVAAVLPRLWPHADVHFGLFLALLVVLVLAWALRETVWGYETRLVGMGADAAEASGVAPAQVRLRAMLLSGALAGLAGAVAVFGETPFRRFPADFYETGYGFEGLAVALLAGPRTLALLPAALLFGGLGSGALAMDFAADTPRQLVMAVEGILIAGLTARLVLTKKGKAP